LTEITCDIFVWVVGVWQREIWTSGVYAWYDESHQAHTPQVQKINLPNTDYAHKNITGNFSQALPTLPEDGSQRIRNLSEFLIVF